MPSSARGVCCLLFPLSAKRSSFFCVVYFVADSSAARSLSSSRLAVSLPHFSRGRDGISLALMFVPTISYPLFWLSLVIFALVCACMFSFISALAVEPPPSSATSSAKRKSGKFFGGLFGKKKDSPEVCVVGLPATDSSSSLECSVDTCFGVFLGAAQR